MAKSSDGKTKCACVHSVWGEGRIRSRIKDRQGIKDGDEAGMENKDQLIKGFECHAWEVEFRK